MDLVGFSRSMALHQVQWTLAGGAMGAVAGLSGGAGLLAVLAGGAAIVGAKYVIGGNGTTVDNIFAALPWAPFGALPATHIRRYKEIINNNGILPPEVLGAIILAELNAYNVFDAFFDDFQFEVTHSIGITQTRVDTVQKLGLMPWASIPQIHNALMEPDTAIILLARQLDAYARMSPALKANLNRWDMLNEVEQLRIIRLLTGAKDAGRPTHTGFSNDGERAYSELRNGHYLK